jgi:hypothetical protein
MEVSEETDECLRFLLVEAVKPKEINFLPSEKND